MFHFILFLFINMEAACHSQQPPCWTAAAAAFHLEWVMTWSGCISGSWQAAHRVLSRTLPLQMPGPIVSSDGSFRSL